MALPFASSLAGLANPSLAGLARLAHALAASRAALAIAQRFTTAASAAAGAAAAPAVAARLPTDRLQRAITPAVCQSLRHNGYAVIDGVFGEETAAALRGELQAMRGHMHKVS